jgi:hypothetical protein
VRQVRKLFKIAQKIKLGIFLGTVLGLAIVSPVQVSTGTETISQTSVQIISNNNEVEQIVFNFPPFHLYGKTASEFLLVQDPKCQYVRKLILLS